MKIKNLSNSSSFLRSNSINNLSNSSSQQTIRISEIDPLYSELTENGLLETSFLNPEGSQFPFASKQISIGRLGNFIGNNQTHENLLTNDKTIIGAINELHNSGGGGLSLPNWAGPHNSICRGNWLGPLNPESPFYSEENYKYPQQLQMIRNGTFDDIYIGDFWSDDPDHNSAETPAWRVAAINYYQKSITGNSIIYSPHVVVVPDYPLLSNAPMNYQFSYSSFKPQSRDYYTGGMDGEGCGEAYTWMRGYCDKYEEFTITNGETAFDTSRNYDTIARVIVLDQNNQVYHGNYKFKPRKRLTTGLRQLNGITITSNHFCDPETGLQDLTPLPNGFKIQIYYKVKNTNIKVNNYDASSNWNAFYYQGLPECEKIISNLFGANNLMTFPVNLKNGKIQYHNHMTNDNNYDNYEMNSLNTKVELMSECQLFGHRTLSSDLKFLSNYSCTTSPYNEYHKEFIGYNQNMESIFPLFQYVPDLTRNECSYWLRDLVDDKSWDGTGYNLVKGSDTFLHISNQGTLMPIRSMPARGWTIGPIGVRPYFCIY